MILTICITSVVVLSCLAAYRIYFKKLFEDLKKYTELRKFYSKMGSENKKSIILLNRKINYKKYLESSSYRCTLISDINNNSFYPTVVPYISISDKITYMKNPNTSKTLADLKIANLCTYVRNGYYYRYDDGHLIISNNTPLYYYIKNNENDKN